MSKAACWYAIGLFVALAGVVSAKEAGTVAEIDPALMTESFLFAHPDLRWRGEGIRAYDADNHVLAAGYFRRAARYADKPSQAMLAEMYWRGVGVDQDRVLGYVWMDLAGERLYQDFILMRERYWNELNERERAAALERGEAIYAEFGDAVAKPRLDNVLRRQRRTVTGSRTGVVGNLTIIPGGGSLTTSGSLTGPGLILRGDEYYAKEYWEPARYWRLQDEIWSAPQAGRVDAGDLQPVRQRNDDED